MNNFEGPLGEDLSSKLDAVLELVKDVPEIKSDVKDLKEDMGEVKGRLDNIEAVVREHSRQLSRG